VPQSRGTQVAEDSLTQRVTRECTRGRRGPNPMNECIDLTVRFYPSIIHRYLT